MHKQSLFHISKRDALPWYQRVLIRGGAILLALIVCALVTMLLTGENPISIYGTIFYGAFLILANLVVDLVYGVIDPRVKLQEG